MRLVCPGELTYVSGDPGDYSSYYCDAGFIIHNLQFSATELDPVLIAGAVGAGFFSLIPLWLAIIGGRFLLRAIR